MRPIIKYRGGKTREIPLFRDYIPTDYDTYYEPFLGGGAVYFHLEPSRAVLNDLNPKLMAFYSDVRDRYPAVRAQLDALETAYERNQREWEEAKERGESVRSANETLYYRIRDMYNGKVESEYLPGVLYYFINKTTYVGILRCNAAGEFNNSFGGNKHFNTKLLTQAHSDLLQRAELCCGDYRESFRRATDRDFMFLDPPYGSFTNYGNKNSWGDREHIELADEFRRLKCRALMIIAKSPLTEELYRGLIRGEYDKKYGCNIKNRFKSAAIHMIVANY